MVTRPNRTCQALFISTPDEDSPIREWSFSESATEEPWWGTRLRIHPSFKGEKVFLEIEWQHRGPWLGYDENNLPLYDGSIKRQASSAFLMRDLCFSKAR